MAALAVRLFEAAMDDNHRRIRDAAAAASGAANRVLDLGCWDGRTYRAYAPPSKHLFGLELDLAAAGQARADGISMVAGDLGCPLPFRSGLFDVVTSNQVIEHLYDTDNFVAEVFRVLRPGGTAVVSTENAASWHNIASLLLGWQSFSLTNISDRRSGIGNPLALWRDREPGDRGWQHVRVLAYRGLKELFGAHGFVDVGVVGTGYYPLPTRVGRWDPRHAAFITVVATKPAADRSSASSP